MWTFLGLSAVMVAVVFMLQVGTVSPGAPDVYEEPCDDETVAPELPGEPMPGPVLEPFDPVGVEPVTGPEGPPMGPVQARVPVAPGAGIDVPGQAQEVEPEPPGATVAYPAVVDDSASVEDQGEAAAEVPEGEAAEALPKPVEATATPREADLEAAGREATEAPEFPESVETEVEHAGAPVHAELRLLPVRMRVPAPRGALGYRLPLVVRQRVPAQIRGGVYIPAHETYVVLQPGHWEPQGTAEDPAAAAVGEPTEAAEAPEGCWLRRLFRKLGRCDGGS